MTSPIALFEVFEGRVRSDPGKVLLRARDGGEELTASELLERVTSEGAALSASGLAPGQVVLLERAGGAAFVIGMLAIWACDAVALAADAQLSDGELDDLRATFAPHVTLAQAADGRLAVRSGSAPRVNHAPELPAGTGVIKITSGSTGRPRGIAATAGQLLADARHIVEGMKVSPDDTNVGAIPLSHSYGMDSLLMPLVVQASPLMLVAPLPEPLAQALSMQEPAVFPGVPFLFEMLARPESPAVRRRGLKCCISAGAVLRSRTAAAFRERCGLPVRAFYGTSETGGITFDASPDGDAAIRNEGCVGAPLPGVDVVLESMAGDGGCDTGGEGRVVVRGDNVASGYVGVTGLEDAPHPQRVKDDGEFRSGAFLTGDTGRMSVRDSRSELRLTGRLAGFVNVSGRKVNPREVERALMEIPGVRDAAVLGVPDEARGESLVACLVADPHVTRETALACLRRGLAAYKLPRRVVFLPALPRTERGKLDAEALRGHAAESRHG